MMRSSPDQSCLCVQACKIMCWSARFQKSLKSDSARCPICIHHRSGGWTWTRDATRTMLPFFSPALFSIPTGMRVLTTPEFRLDRMERQQTAQPNALGLPLTAPKSGSASLVGCCCTPSKFYTKTRPVHQEVTRP